MKETWNKIVMDDKKKEAIRKSLISVTNRSHTWIKVVASVAAVVAAVMIIPFTRNKILTAAESLFYRITGKNGMEIQFVQDDEGKVVSGTLTNPGSDFVCVKDNRLYLTINGESTDITDQCSESDFYYQKFANDDGTYSLIYAGGTISEYGWIEVLITPNFEIDETGKEHAAAIILPGGCAHTEERKHEWDRKARADSDSKVYEIMKDL